MSIEKVYNIVTADNVENKLYRIDEVNNSLIKLEFFGNRRRVLRLDGDYITVISNMSRKNIVAKLGAIQSKWIGHYVYPKEIREMNGHKFIVWDVGEKPLTV